MAEDQGAEDREGIRATSGRMIGDHRSVLAAMRQHGAFDPVPTEEEMRAHARLTIAARGYGPAQSDYAYLQRVAAEIWGPKPTAHLARAWRAVTVKKKAAAQDRWTSARRALKVLPEAWRSPLGEIIERSAGLGSSSARRADGTIWSSDHAASVCRAMSRWIAHRRSIGADDLRPMGVSLDAWGWWLVDESRGEDAITVRAASDYLGRVMVGMAIVAPEAATMACAFVVKDWRERGRAEGATTKTGDQLVGAAAIHDLGLEEIARAIASPRRTVQTAVRYRDGLLLVLGTILPQRARALSCLRFGSTFRIHPDAIVIDIPARHLKLPEAEKLTAEPYRRRLEGPGFLRIVDRYQREFRPLIDDGDALFPSLKAPGEALSSKRLGIISGDLTERGLKVRIPLHRIRDNVATDATELLGGGALAAASLLDHKDPMTTARHYDRGDGQKAMRSLSELLDRRRTPAPEFEL